MGPGNDLDEFLASAQELLASGGQEVNDFAWTIHGCVMLWRATLLFVMMITRHHHSLGLSARTDALRDR